MKCFDCGKDKDFLFRVYYLFNGLLGSVCKKCFKRSYKPWMVTAG